jgi:hypothetical protein
MTKYFLIIIIAVGFTMLLQQGCDHYQFSNHSQISPFYDTIINGDTFHIQRGDTIERIDSQTFRYHSHHDTAQLKNGSYKCWDTTEHRYVHVIPLSITKSKCIKSISIIEPDTINVNQ